MNISAAPDFRTRPDTSGPLVPRSPLHVKIIMSLRKVGIASVSTIPTIRRLARIPANSSRTFATGWTCTLVPTPGDAPPGRFGTTD